MTTRHRFARTLAPLAFIGMLVGSCGSDDSSTTASPSGATTGSSSTVTTGSTTTAPASTSTTVPANAGVSAEDLDRAEHVVLTFVDSLGAGDLDAAGAVVGPVSEERAAAAGGLRSLLQTSTEGHGAWRAVTDRTVTSIAVEPGLVVVVLEGTLRVEGTTEHRVAAFAARKAESAGAWFAEPWAYDLAADPPMAITNPHVDAEEIARVAAGADLQVTAAVGAPGTVWASFDAARPTPKEASNDGTVTFSARASEVDLVTLVFHAGPTLYATAFRVQTGDAPQPTTAPPADIAVPFLDEATNALLTKCAAGDAASCDRAQVPGVLDDGAFSYFHQQCDGGRALYCVLFDNLVAAEKRLHGI
jgi:hypothetical protein